MKGEAIGPLAAFVGGLLSFTSPCVLPMVPVYLSLITGYSIKELQEKDFRIKGILFPTAVFVAGFTCSFVLMGATATTIGELLNRNYLIFKKIVGVFMIIWGVMLVGLKPSIFYRSFSINKGNSGSSIGVFVMGVAFGLSWSPCVGAILVPILSMAALKETMTAGIFMLFCYSMGIALPLVVVSLALAKGMSLLSPIQEHFKKVEVATGVLVILFGLYLLSGGRL